MWIRDVLAWVGGSEAILGMQLEHGKYCTLSPNLGLGAEKIGQKSWPPLKSHGKNPKVCFWMYFAILSTMAALKFYKNYCESDYQICQVWVSCTVVLAADVFALIFVSACYGCIATLRSIHPTKLLDVASMMCAIGKSTLLAKVLSQVNIT